MNDILADISIEEDKTKEINYKIDKCKNWEKYKTCKYGEKCVFAHGDNELGNKENNINQIISTNPLMHDKDKIPKNMESEIQFNQIKMMNNFIIAEIYIKKEDINKDIKIINSFEDYEDDECKYEKEKGIKEKCTIEINNRKIAFNYFYKFKEEGKYIIKYIS